MTIPEVYTSDKVQEAIRCIEMSMPDKIYPVNLTGSQVLLIERALTIALKSFRAYLKENEFDTDLHRSADAKFTAFERVRSLLKNATFVDAKKLARVNGLTTDKHPWKDFSFAAGDQS